MKTLLILVLASQSADLISTLQKLKQGCVESSPLVKKLHITTPVRISLLKGGVMGGYVWTWGKAHKHPTTAFKLVSGIGIGAATVAATHNWMTDCKR